MSKIQFNLVLIYSLLVETRKVKFSSDIGYS